MRWNLPRLFCVGVPGYSSYNNVVLSSKVHAQLSSPVAKWSPFISTTSMWYKPRRVHNKVDTSTNEPVTTSIGVTEQTQQTKSSPTESRQVLLSNPALVVCRELEWGNIFFGFEQANKYSLKTPDGQVAGYIAEEDGLGRSLLRNILRTHRSFKATILDPTGQPVMVIRRPAYLLTSSLYVETPEGESIGEIRMNWHPWRRKYDLYVNKRQFGKIDSGFLAVEFPIQDEHGNVIGSVSKDFTGFAKELFTDATQYVVRLRPPSELVLDNNGIIQMNSSVTNPAETNTSETSLSTEERAVLFAVAVSVDFDYFSLHSRHGSFMPFPFMMPFPWPGSGGGGGGEQGEQESANSQDNPTSKDTSSTGTTEPDGDSSNGFGEDSKWAHFEEGKFEEPDNMFEEDNSSGWSFGSFFGDDDDDDD
ncbi:phospholipid scramblase-like protein [Galdieria sulphuraria]|uniref:Phospholipid scramblase n=1 Tax=Galdieria sulphuraria TaxID=130081 RepID=M2X4U5_GALSU|nr:phospholipid scramblase-like protein [Galdieria sulphuraria]EME31480.1 phospholipid scramblase-like protein [Galdieria sulphuraria]|eukprot:XP_005708000.1 phospholipid scramblase-like protein [Galdieria sulphuraria]